MEGKNIWRYKEIEIDIKEYRNVIKGIQEQKNG